MTVWCRVEAIEAGGRLDHLRCQAKLGWVTEMQETGSGPEPDSSQPSK
jgi:hypothetical protein